MSDPLIFLNTSIVVVNSLIIIAGVLMTLRHFRLTRTWSYIERYNSNDMMEIRIAVAIFLAEVKNLEPEEVVDRVSQLRAATDPKQIRLRIQVDTLINLFTEVGVAYKSGAIDKKAATVIDALIPRYWNDLEPYVRVCQEYAKPYKIFTGFEYMKDRFDPAI